MIKESVALEKKIFELSDKIASLPQGKLQFVKNGKYIKWFQRYDNVKKYISKSDKHTAELLALKNYYCDLLQDLKCEKKAIDAYFKYYPKYKKSDEDMNNKVMTELLAANFTHISIELNEWMNEEYETNSYFKENLTFDSVSGNIVRSKSEAIIDMLLYMNKIPFRYEAALKLGNSKIYLDFTVRHPKTGELYYWEHFGAMDKDAYKRNVIPKLQMYINNDIIPTINLITTYETSDNPLTSKQVERIINEYFL